MPSVYFYVPNIIGYFRVLTLLAGMSVALDPAYWQISLGLYGTSQLLDAFDGLAARALNQSSQFGAVLDMVSHAFICGRKLQNEQSSTSSTVLSSELFSQFRLSKLN